MSPFRHARPDVVEATPALATGEAFLRRVLFSSAAAAVALSLSATGAWAQDSETIEAILTTADGQDAGTVTFEQTLTGVVVTAFLQNLPEGEHGFHIHQTGACEPDFQAAGGHYNLLDAAHGFDAEGGYHVGDLPNVHVDADGTAQADFFAPQLTLTAEGADDAVPFTLRDGDGSVIMVHEQPDDYQTEPSSGGRLACGVIAAPQG